LGQAVHRLAAAVGEEVGIPHGHGISLVAQELLEHQDVHAVAGQVAGEGAEGASGLDGARLHARPRSGIVTPLDTLGILMSSNPNIKLLDRVNRAVSALIEREGRVTYPSLLCEMGVLTPKNLAEWRAGHAQCLERVVSSSLAKLARIQAAVRRIARDRRLDRKLVRAPRGRRYSKTGHPFIEDEYGAVYGAGNPAGRRSHPA